MIYRVMALIAAMGLLNGCIPVVAGAGAGAGVVAAQERTTGSAIDDVGIDAKIANKFFKSDIRELTTSVSTEVTEGTVLLTGKVQKPEHAVEAVRLVWEVEGVREVINEIQVTNGDSTTYPRDAWITTQVKTRLIAEKYIKSVNYNIETVASVVYVMGIAQNQQELDRVLNVISRVSGVVQVISHVRLKDDPRRPIPTAQPTNS